MSLTSAGPCSQVQNMMQLARLKWGVKQPIAHDPVENAMKQVKALHLALVDAQANGSQLVNGTTPILVPIAYVM